MVANSLLYRDFFQHLHRNLISLEENGKIYFCGFDVAKALGYAKPNNAISAHCKGTLKRGRTGDVLYHRG